MEEINSELIIGGRNDGLGTRFINFLLCEAISECYGLRVIHIWPTLPKSHNKAEDSISDIFSGKTLEKFILINERLTELSAKDAIKTTGSKKWMRDIKIDADLIDNMARKSITFKKIFENIEFNPKIKMGMDVIDNFFSGIDTKNSFGLHYRGGDVEKDVARWFHVKYVPIEFYENLIINKAYSKPFIYLSTNSKKELSRLKSNYLVHSFNDVIKENLNGIQNDFLEIYILTKMKIIYAPKNSFYTKASSIISGNKVVDIAEEIVGINILSSIKKMLNNKNNLI
jgi:hypothetical protein